MNHVCQISRVRDPNLQSQRFELEIQITRVRDSSFITRFVFNLQSQRFKPPESEIQISRVRDSSWRLKSPESEIQISRARDSNKYNPVSTTTCTTTEAKNNNNILLVVLSLLQTCYIQQVLCCFYMFFIAITGNVFVSIGVNVTMVIFSTYLNTTWTIT